MSSLILLVIGVLLGFLVGKKCENMLYDDWLSEQEERGFILWDEDFNPMELEKIQEAKKMRELRLKQSLPVDAFEKDTVVSL